MLSRVVLVAAMASASAWAEQPPTQSNLHEPVYRVSKSETVEAEPRTAPVSSRAAEAHPLDPALEMARECLQKIRSEVRDYEAIVVKRERTGNTLGEHQYMLTKIRQPQARDGKPDVPFSVFLHFLKPTNVQGRKVLYIDGQNDGKLLVREAGIKGKMLGSLSLEPDGMVAMMNQRYPITDIGIENLCLKLLEKGVRDKRLGTCDVKMQPARINGRPCTRIQVEHPNRLPHLDFHLARIFVDDEYEVPIRYEAYDWPHQEGEPVGEEDLIEEYTYMKLKLNVGLSDRDFQPSTHRM